MERCDPDDYHYVDVCDPDRILSRQHRLTERGISDSVQWQQTRLQCVSKHYVIFIGGHYFYKLPAAGIVHFTQAG